MQRIQPGNAGASIWVGSAALGMPAQQMGQTLGRATDTLVIYCIDFSTGTKQETHDVDVPCTSRHQSLGVGMAHGLEWGVAWRYKVKVPLAQRKLGTWR